MKRASALSGAIAVTALCVCASVVAAPITRLDIYDKADNHLLFVTFEYGGSGDCIGRSVFASDSSFLCSTVFQPGTATTATKENSMDYNGNPLYTTTVSPPSAGTTTFSTVDQFGLAQFGPPLSYSESTANTFDVTQNNAALCKEQYEFDGSGDLTRISVLDKDGVLAWYALARHQTTALRPTEPLPSVRPARVTASPGKIRLHFELLSAGVVKAELYTPAGRKTLTIIDKRVTAGSHHITVDGALPGNGTYVVKMTVNGVVSLARLIAVQK